MVTATKEPTEATLGLGTRKAAAARLLAALQLIDLLHSVDGPGLRAGPVWVNPETADVLVSGRPVELTPVQLRIVALLVKNGGRIVGRERIAQEVWGADPPVCARHYLAMHIKNLRVKLGDNCDQPSIIVNVRGMGYKIGGELW